MDKNRLCLVTPSLNAGGMQRVMSELASYFSDNRCIQTHIIIYGISHEIFYEITDTIIIHTPDFNFNNKFRMFNTFRTLFYLRKEIKKIDPDSVLSFGEIWNSFVLIALVGLKYPVFVSDRCRPDKSFGKAHNFLRKRLYPIASGVIAQTERAKKIYESQFRNDNVVIIGNPIRSIAYNVDISKENIIVSVGRLITSKHFDQLINIFSHVNKLDWKLIIVGGDAIKQNNSSLLKKQIDSLGLNGKVILTGSQKNIDDYLLKSKIFAFTSSSEGFPNVIGEAMSAGLPVIAYDCVAGPEEMISDGEDGFLIPVFDVKTFEEKLMYLMENPDEVNRMGRNAKEKIKQFSIENIGEKFFQTIIKA